MTTGAALVIIAGTITAMHSEQAFAQNKTSTIISEPVKVQSVRNFQTDLKNVQTDFKNIQTDFKNIQTDMTSPGIVGSAPTTIGTAQPTAGRAITGTQPTPFLLGRLNPAYASGVTTAQALTHSRRDSAHM